MFSRKLIAFLLVASSLSGFDISGVVVPFLKTYSYGSKDYGDILSNASATGIYNLGILNLNEYTMSFGSISGKTRANGVLASASITMTGGKIYAKNIQSESGEAYGVNAGNGLYFTLGTAYLLIGKMRSSVEFENIQGGSNAYGLSSNSTSTFKGRGSVKIGNITALAGEAGGMKSGEIKITDSTLDFYGKIEGISKSYGLKLSSLTSENADFSFGAISSSGEAVGMEFGSSSRNSSKSTQITFSSIASKTSDSYGIKNTQGSIDWGFEGDLFEKDRDNVLSFSNISSENGNAFGIYTTQSLNIQSHNTYSQDRFVFDRISSNSGYAIGLYTKGGSVNIALDNQALLSFNSLSSNSQSSYGIVADGGSVNLKLTNSTLKIGIVGNGGAFAQRNGGKVNLEMVGGSALYLEGNGGIINELRVDEDALVDISGVYGGGLENRNISRTLTINKLANYNYIRNGNMAIFGLYIDVDKGIADRVSIKDVYDSCNQGIELKVFYRPSSTQTLSAKATPYVLLAQTASDAYANGMNENNLVGYSETKEGFLQVSTILHRYNQGNEALYYIDTQEKQTYRIVLDDVRGGIEGVLSHYGAYFLGADSLSNRAGDLRGGNERSGIWGRMDFGGVNLGVSNGLHMAEFEVGGDYLIESEGGGIFVGGSVGYAPSLSTPPKVADSSRVDLALYGGVLYEGLFYNLYLKANYFQSTLIQDSIMNEASFNQWAIGINNELGYRFLANSQEKGVFVEPSAWLNFVFFTPTHYQQEARDGNMLDVKIKSASALDSRIGGRVGYNFKEGTDIFFGAFYTYKHFFDNGVEFKTLIQSQEIRESWELESRELNGMTMSVGSNIQISSHSKLYLDLDFGFAQRFATMYKLDFSYRFVF